MAKIINAKRGNISIEGGVIDIVGAQYVKFVDYTGSDGGPSVVRRWVVQWAVYESIEEANKPHQSGRVLQSGDVLIDYVEGCDPVLEAYRRIHDLLSAEWDISASEEIGDISNP